MPRRAVQLFASVLLSCAQPDGPSVFDPRTPLQPTGACSSVADEPPGSPPTLLESAGFGRLSSTLVPLEASVVRVVTLPNVPCRAGNGSVRAWLTDSAGRREVSAGPVAFSPDDQTLSTAVTLQTSVPGRLELEVDFVGVGTARHVLTAVEDRSAAQRAGDAVFADSDQIFRGGNHIGSVFVPAVVGNAVWSSVLDGGQIIVSSWFETGARLVKRGDHSIEANWGWTGTSESRLVFTRQGSAMTLTWQLGAFVEEAIAVPPDWSRPIVMAGGGFVGLDEASGFCEVAADGGCALVGFRIAELRSEGVIAVPPSDDRFVLLDRRGSARAEIEFPPSSRLVLRYLSRGVEGAGSHLMHESFVLVPRFDDRPRLLAFRAGGDVQLTRDWVFIGRGGFSR